jgi:2-C-methyl-D-erythritol 4-phosphate cytidylyltransferase
MRYWLVMPAAGSGSRFGADGPKQYAPLEGRTVIEWALAPFLADPRCAHIVVALARDDTGWERVAPRLDAPGTSTLTAVGGAAQRSHSVRLALAALDGRAGLDDWVLVHDAARPCLDAHDLESLLGRLGTHPVGGLLAIPAADTLKRAQSGEGTGSEVAQTVDRSGLWRALTPQMFRYGRLCAALDQAHAAGRFPSDEAQALEWMGEHPALIEGAATNLKITTGEDLALAAAVLRARRGQAAAQDSS